MQRFASSCTPEQLQTLQKIFDLIWMELQANGHSNYTGPSDPDALREEIARRVLGSHDGDDVLDANDITKRVLASFGVHTDLLSASVDRANDATKPDSTG